MAAGRQAVAAVAAALGSLAAWAAQEQLVILPDPTQLVLQVRGDTDEDWWFQSSTDLVNWVTLTNWGTLLSGTETGAPPKTAGVATNSGLYYRTLRTDGLYDVAILRTMSLSFASANYTQLLAQAWISGGSVTGDLVLNNGATNLSIGARYRGNTSYTASGVKKSIAIDADIVHTNADLMGYNSLNLNNAFGDNTLMHEAIYFNVMRQYAVCPRASLVQLFINNTNWGVYSFNMQQDGDLIRDWMPSNDGDRWRAPNPPNASGTTALRWLGASAASYSNNYELKATTTNAHEAYRRLISAISNLHFAASSTFNDVAENFLAVDRWCWFLALENVFADDDSYFNKGADYMMYYELESGRLHPVEHDGNESFFAGDAALSPFSGQGNTNRPVLRRFLDTPELRQRYLAHLRTVLVESYNATNMNRWINLFHSNTVAAIAADPKKPFTMAQFSNELNNLRAFVTNRAHRISTNIEYRAVAPTIAAVYGPTGTPTALDVPALTAQVASGGTNGVHSVWLYHRGKSYGRFWWSQMFDDGAHQDGTAGDGLYGGTISNYPAGTKVRYYVEARSANTNRTAVFSPARAEEETYSYRVTVTAATGTPVVINEFMASNTNALADPQGEYDDWIELRNLTTNTVDLTGRYLSDEPTNPRKWQFPTGTVIAAEGYLLVWADEDTTNTPGLHASFKLSAAGEEFFLTDTDANLNAILDSINFPAQTENLSYGRSATNEDAWVIMAPTPLAPNL